MQSLIDTVLEQLKGYTYKRVERVRLEVGELSFLSKDALEFAFNAMTASTPLEGAKLEIIDKGAVVECSDCGYKGPIQVEEREEFHTIFVPVFSCPKCGGPVMVIEGRDCFVQSVDLVTEDNGDCGN